jgi:tetratricopeptide (TPR) repeat protein
MVQWRSGRTNEAEACLQKALEDPGLGNPAPAHYLLCLVEWDRGNPKAARRAFGAFLQAELTRTDLENPFRSDLGVELVETQAHAAYRHLREKNWDRLETHQQISEILIRTKADDLLRPVLETVVRLQPDSADFWTKLAVMANAAGDFERAQEASRRALALKPNHAYAHWALGFSQCALGEWEAGRKSLENATVLEGRAGAALEALAALEEVQGNHPAALRVLAAARKVFPGAVPPNRLGFVIPDARAIRIEAIRDLRGF